MNSFLLFFIPMLLCVALTAAGVGVLLPRLKEKRLSQTILDIGPRWHKKKEGTPTMGGIVFVCVAIFIGGIASLVLWRVNGASEAVPLILLLSYAVLNGCIGIKDDLTKLRKHQNEGLRPMQKIVLQAAVGALFLAFLHLSGCVDTTLFIPYVGIRLELSFLYDFIVLFLLVGVVNCANLTDGVDGLCASVTAVIGIFFAVAAALTEEAAVTVASSVLSGTALGFLFYNRHPARIFMGDTGSLFFGALAAGSAVLLGNPLILLFASFVFILEGVSDVLQVLVYKITKKRILRMAPLHHHFEMLGFSEKRIVLIFTLISAVFAALAVFGLDLVW